MKSRQIKNKKDNQRVRVLRKRVISMLTAGIVLASTYGMGFSVAASDEGSVPQEPPVVEAVQSVEEVAPAPEAVSVTEEASATETTSEEVMPTEEQTETTVIEEEDVPLAEPSQDADVQTDAGSDATSDTSDSPLVDPSVNTPSEPAEEAVPPVSEEAESSLQNDIETDDDETADTEKEDDEEDEEDEEEVTYPAQRFEKKLDGNKLIVVAEAEEGAFPEGTTMEAAMVGDKAILDKITDAVEDEETTVTSVKAVDITFKDKDGKEIEPKKAIKVTITSDEIAKAEDNTIVHVDDNGQTQIVKAEDPNANHLQENEILFKGDQFSIYAIVGTTYTVDFHFEVNGKTLNHSIPGGGFITLSEIARMMGLLSDAENAEEWNAFIGQVESVRFSDPSLISVSKVDNNTTVGNVKNALGLNCTYSELLTEADIEQINGTELFAPDWILISLRPFVSEELLTVTLKDGQQFTVRVTDSQLALNIHSNIVDLHGNHINLQEHVMNSFTVYRKQGTETNPIDGQEVKDLNIGEDTESIDYSDYSESGSASVQVGNNGSGMIYVYNPELGMYYIKQTSVPQTITDSEGQLWKYVGTRMETEYVWREGSPYNNMLHISESTSSVPEVVGTYKNYDGTKWTWTNDQGDEEALLNTFLDFYAYNIYEPIAGSIKITKMVTVNGEATSTQAADGEYSFEIWSADGTEQITQAADGTPLGELKLTITNGVSASLVVSGIHGGTYIIRETESTNPASMEMTEQEVGYDPSLRGIVVNVNDETEPAEAVFLNDVGIIQQTVKKVWVGGTTPANLTVKLYANEEETNTVVTLNAGNGWQTTVNDLPKYSDGEPITYHWVEGYVPEGFFVTAYDVVNNDDGTVTTTTITNTHRTYEFTTFYEGTKTWNDESDILGDRPNHLHVTLYASYVINPGEETPIYGEPEATFFEPVWIKSGDTWTFRFENIPVFDENGEVIIYTSSETVPAGYDCEESVIPTEYTLGSFVLESGHQRVTPNSTKRWDIASLLDLPVVGIKKGGDYIIWSPRTPTPREEAAARQALALEAHEGFRNATWYVDAQRIPTDSPGNTVTTAFNPEADPPYFSLTFNRSSAWSWFVIGTFKGGENKYEKGTADFINTLAHVTPEFTGTKIWEIAGDTVPADPSLKLTRTVTITPAEGEPYTTAPETVNATPEWSGDGKIRSFVYHDLPKYDSDGNEYTYHVAETSFTVDGVTYTTVRHSDGTYTVTSSDEAAPIYVTTQVDEPIEGSKQYKPTITNAESTDFSFSKIWYNNDNEIDIWPEGKTITVTLNAFTEDEDKALENSEVTLNPFDLPPGWEVSVNSSGTRTTFRTSGLPTTKDGKALTYYVVETQVDGYQPPVYQTSDGAPIEGGDKALDGQQIVNIPVRVPIELTKIGDWTVSNTLSGVQFKLFSDVGCTAQILVDSNGDPIGADGVITTVDGGKASIGTFTPGTYYLLETKTVDGYNMLSEVIPFTINSNGSVMYTTGNTDFDKTPGATYETDNGIGIYINNMSGVELPKTGGSGTAPFILGGIGLILASALIYTFKLRRRERRRR